MELKEIIKRYPLKFRLRLGFSEWGETIRKEDLRIVGGFFEAGVFLVEHGSKEYFLTPSGLFPISRTDQPDRLFGIDLRSVRSPEELRSRVERQLYLRMRIMDSVGWRMPERGFEILDFEPEIGAIFDRTVEYDEGRWYLIAEETRMHASEYRRVFENHKGRWIVLPHRIRTIPELLYSVYGDEIPDRSVIGDSIFEAIKSPPWAIRYFGEPRKAYLIDRDEKNNLCVYAFEKNEFAPSELFLAFDGKWTHRFNSPEKERPKVRDAFRLVFGVDLPPDATPDDIEAIAALRAIGT